MHIAALAPIRNFTGYIALIVMLLVILSGAMYKHKVLKVSVITLAFGGCVRIGWSYSFTRSIK
jgi:hypothetical protein